MIRCTNKIGGFSVNSSDMVRIIEIIEFFREEMMTDGNSLKILFIIPKNNLYCIHKYYSSFSLFNSANWLFRKRDCNSRFSYNKK